jgi:hypothetical protein
MSSSTTKTVGRVCEALGGTKSWLRESIGKGVLPIGIAIVAAELIFLLLKNWWL